MAPSNHDRTGQAFEALVSQLLELTGYTIARDVLISGTQIDIVAHRAGELATVRYLVECTDTTRTVGIKYVKEKTATLVSLQDSDAIPCLVIVAQAGFSAEARAFADTRPDVLLLTIRDLEAQLVDFSPYRNWYMQGYTLGTGPFADAALHKRYVQVSADSDGETVGLTEAVKAWLAASGNNVLFLLGDYGAGKTSFLRYLAYDMLRTPGPLSQTAILVPLREYQRASNLRQVITDLLVNEYGVALRSGFKAFERLCDLGRIALLLDGFDEMAARSDQETLIDCFGQIFLLAETNAKVIVSCRSNFFRSHADVIKLLRTFDIEIDTGGETADIASLGNLPLGRHGRVLTIAPLSTEQIAEYVRAHFPDHADAITEQMEKVHDLTDLARRPVLLDMILSTLPALRDDDIRLNSANLYEIYTNRWARRDSWRVKLPLEARQILCEGLAWLMLARDKAHFTFAELRETLAVVLEDIVRNAEIFPDVVNDIQTCSFLVRAGRGDTYAMAHKSFSEFFAGRTIAKLLSRRQASEPALRTHRAGGSPRADPYADLLYADDATLAVPNTAGRPASAGVGAGPHRDVAVRVALAWRLDIEPLLVHDGLVSTHSTLRLDWDPSIESFLEDRIMRVFGAPLHETRALPFELSPEIATFALEWLSLNEVRVADLIDVAERADRLGMLTEVMRLGTAAEFWEANTDTLMEALSDPDPDHEAFVAAIACAVTQTSRVRTVDALREIAALVSEEALAVAMLTMAQGAPAKRMIVRAYAKAHSSDLVAILGIYAARDLLSPSQYVLRLFRAAKEMRGSRAGNDLSREITRVCTPAPSVLVGAAVEVAAQGELDDAIWDDVVRAIKLSATIEEADRVKRLWMSTSEPVAVRKLQRLERHLRGAAASRRGSPARSDIGRPRTNERVWRALAKTR